MRKVVGVLFAVAMVLPVGLLVSAAGAFTFPSPYFGYCTTLTGSVTFSPPIPIAGKGMVIPTANGTINMGGCVDLGGPTGGTAVWSESPTAPSDCSNYANHGNWHGSLVITWNTGQTSTVSDFQDQSGLGGFGPISAGFLPGTAVMLSNFIYRNTTMGVCTTVPLASWTLSENGIQTFQFPGTDSATCLAPQSCDLFAASSATATTPALTVTVSGTPASGTGTVSTRIASGSVPCPSVPKAVAPIADLTDTGFAPTDRLTVTATYPFTTSTSAQQVCFNSTLPFLSQSSPTVPKLGPALLLTCTMTANVAPCVLSTGQVGTDLVVKFVVPGVDPTFSLVEPTGRQAWLAGVPVATIHVPFSTHFYSRGGKAPVYWSRASGKLPPGCALSANTGVITGTPTAKGKFGFVVQATDSEKPPKIVKMMVPITVT